MKKSFVESGHFLVRQGFRSKLIMRLIDLFKLSPLGDYMNYIFKHLDSVIEDHKATYSDGSRRDFIDCYISDVMVRAMSLLIHHQCCDCFFHQDHSSPETIEDGYINLRNVLNDMFAGGAETTSTTLNWSILYMAKYPEIQVRNIFFGVCLVILLFFRQKWSKKSKECADRER